MEVCVRLGHLCLVLWGLDANVWRNRGYVKWMVAGRDIAGE
jgi:hypothetical protein